MTAVLYSLCAGVAFVAFAWKLRRVVRSGFEPAQIWLAGVFFTFAWTYGVILPGVWYPLSEAFGLPNVSGLLSHLGVVFGITCQQVVVLHLAHERAVAWRKAAPRMLAMCGVAATMIVLFLVAGDFDVDHPTDFAVTKAASNPWYLSLYLGAYATAQIDTTRLVWRFRRAASSVWLRRGLGLVVASSVLLGIYILGRAAGVVAGLLGSTGHAWEPITALAVTAGSIVYLVAWILPDVGPRLSALWMWLDTFRAHRELAPIHRDLTARVPDVVLDVPADRRTRLYRVLVEIRDAQWQLRTWMDPAVTREATERATAAGLTGDELAAVVEAAQLRAALRAKELDQRPGAHVDMPNRSAPEDLLAELAHQRRLAYHYQHSPVVTAAAAV